MGYNGSGFKGARFRVLVGSSEILADAFCVCFRDVDVQDLLGNEGLRSFGGLAAF